MRAQGLWTQPLHIRIDGGLRLKGEKVGLGESAAVVAGMIRAGVKSTTVGFNEAVQWAIDAHTEASGGRGSGYDVATSFYSGVIGFTPGAPPEVEMLQWPGGLAYGVGFSGRGVSTRSLLGRLSAETPSEPLLRMKQGVLELQTQWRTGSAERILAALEPLDGYLERWSDACGVSLLTPDILRMKELAAQCGAVTRVSGAGGGDSLWVFSTEKERVNATLNAWDQAGYSKLPVTRFLSGKSIRIPG